MNKADKIFLSINNEQPTTQEKRLLVTLQRAGFKLIDKNDVSGNGDLQKETEAAVQNSFCSIHFIGKKYLQQNNVVSLSEHHFHEAKKRIDKDDRYKAFIWMPGKMNDSDTDSKQLEFINRLQHHLSNNMVLSRVPTAIQFVEDVRLILEQQDKKEYPTKPCDVFLIFNQSDEKDVSKVKLMLSGILNIETLSINADSNLDYEEFASQQMNVSKLVVIYYKNASDWAYPFAQQIWKKVGGAAAKSPILFICDAEATNQEIKKISMPKVSTFVLPHELIPLEIKVQFDSIKPTE